jgi:hypothetical protein
MQAFGYCISSFENVIYSSCNIVQMDIADNRPGNQVSAGEESGTVLEKFERSVKVCNKAAGFSGIASSV